MSETDNAADIVTIKRAVRWHIFVFMLPALIVYSAVMVLPLIETLRLSLYNTVDGQPAFVGLANFKV
ncbi:sugar ABC transporter permease, partial [Rhizobium ruizarguesonis]